ncbi:MAG TPA: NAD(P)H-binding protein [Candidatus Saccharimonadia bacterium]|nr:NAD(P)H-binding protein [Candidatus Saccharimonadia bacterium]
MRLLVLGAAGRTGQEVVSQALARGHEVVAFVRRSDVALAPQERLTIVVGDAEDEAAVAQAAAGCDAVVSALGHTSVRRSSAQTTAVAALVKALPAGTRVISLTGFGVPDPKDPSLPWTGRLMNLAIRWVPGGLYHDGAEHARVLRESQLDWTLIRAPRLSTAPARGAYQLGYFRLGADVSIPRADVARGMLDCLVDSTWSRQAPMIRPA